MIDEPEESLQDLMARLDDTRRVEAAEAAAAPSSHLEQLQQAIEDYRRHSLQHTFLVRWYATGRSGCRSLLHIEVLPHLPQAQRQLRRGASALRTRTAALRRRPPVPGSSRIGEGISVQGADLCSASLSRAVSSGMR